MVVPPLPHKAKFVPINRLESVLILILLNHTSSQPILLTQLVTIWALVMITWEVCVWQKSLLHKHAESLCSKSLLQLRNWCLFSLGNRDCNCQDWHGCIMKPTVIGEEGIQPYKFSSCSRKQFNGYLEDGRLLCLLNNPNEPSYAKGGSNCGNGFVDSGEECDCGSINECNNNCCDPITCRFKQEAQCASGECCDVNTCKVSRVLLNNKFKWSPTILYF